MAPAHLLERFFQELTAARAKSHEGLLKRRADDSEDRLPSDTIAAMVGLLGALLIVFVLCWWFNPRHVQRRKEKKFERERPCFNKDIWGAAGDGGSVGPDIEKPLPVVPGGKNGYVVRKAVPSRNIGQYSSSLVRHPHPSPRTSSLPRHKSRSSKTRTKTHRSGHHRNTQSSRLTLESTQHPATTTRVKTKATTSNLTDASDAHYNDRQCKRRSSAPDIFDPYLNYGIPLATTFSSPSKPQGRPRSSSFSTPIVRAEIKPAPGVLLAAAGRRGGSARQQQQQQLKRTEKFYLTQSERAGFRVREDDESEAGTVVSYRSGASSRIGDYIRMIPPSGATPAPEQEQEEKEEERRGRDRTPRPRLPPIRIDGGLAIEMGDINDDKFGT